jgi:hypothetical protein
MKRCHACHERFGLIRHHYNRLQFCSAICVAAYRAALRATVREQAVKTSFRQTTAPARPRLDKAS